MSISVSTADVGTTVSSTELEAGAALANLASASVTDAKLASPNNALYRTVMFVRVAGAAGATAGTYGMRENAAATTAKALGAFWLDPADYAVAGLTTKYRVVATVLTNDTAPAANFTFGLYPISAVSGGAATSDATFGTVTSGSTVLFTAPAADSINHNTSGDFTAPAAGLYSPGVVVSATLATNSNTTLNFLLQWRNV